VAFFRGGKFTLNTTELLQGAAELQVFTSVQNCFLRTSRRRTWVQHSSRQPVPRRHSVTARSHAIVRGCETQESVLITVFFERGGMPETPAGTQMAPESLNFCLRQPTHGSLSN
jgi:hypothetical protein